MQKKRENKNEKEIRKREEYTGAQTISNNIKQGIQKRRLYSKYMGQPIPAQIYYQFHRICATENSSLDFYVIFYAPSNKQKATADWL